MAAIHIPMLGFRNKRDTGCRGKKKPPPPPPNQMLSAPIERNRLRFGLTHSVGRQWGLHPNVLVLAGIDVDRARSGSTASDLEK